MRIVRHDHTQSDPRECSASIDRQRQKESSSWYQQRQGLEEHRSDIEVHKHISHDIEREKEDRKIEEKERRKPKRRKQIKIIGDRIVYE